MMKKFFTFLCVFVFCSVCGWAQKNLFSVPMAEMVEQDKLYFQPSLTFSKQLKSNLVFTYGLGGKFQAGVTLKDITVNYNSADNVVPVEDVNPEENPGVLINMQTGFDITDAWRVGIGTRFGVNIADELDFATFNYLNAQTSVLNNSKIIFGGYYGNFAYLDRGNDFGAMLGVQVPIASDKLKFVGDYISGTNALSVINLGLGVKVSDNWNLSAGWQLPAPDSGNNNGITIQLNN